MIRRLLSLLALGVFAVAARAGQEWSQLKVGMPPADAIKHLGEPLIKTNGRGFEVWYYDGRGEVQFAGSLKAWTNATPTTESLARPVTQDVLIKAAPRRRLPSSFSLPPVDAFREVSSTRFRYR